MNTILYPEGKCVVGTGRSLSLLRLPHRAPQAPSSFFCVSFCESKQWICLCTTRRKKDGNVCRASPEKETFSHQDSWGLLSAPHMLRSRTPANGDRAQGTGECRSEGIQASVARVWLLICTMLFLLPKGVWKLLLRIPKRRRHLRS